MNSFKDDKSNKFWRIKYVSGESKFNINYGRADTTGRFEEKEFDSLYICEKEAAKIIRQKLKKGYVENKTV